MKKVGEVKGEFSAEAIIKFFEVAENLLPGIPYVVGIMGDRVWLSFRRLFFRFEDKYRIETSTRSNSEVEVKFNGEKSTILVLYKIFKSQILVFADYSGPKRWTVWPSVKKLAHAILEYALEHASEAKEELKVAGDDYSKKLADLSWITSTLSKSLLLNTLDVVVRRREFDKFLEGLHTLGVFKEYKVVYVSGSGNGSFRLLFINGELVGVYASVGDREVLGDASKLNDLEGYYKVKVYGVLAPEI